MHFHDSYHIVNDEVLTQLVCTTGYHWSGISGLYFMVNIVIFSRKFRQQLMQFRVIYKFYVVKLIINKYYVIDTFNVIIA